MLRYLHWIILLSLSAARARGQDPTSPDRDVQEVAKRVDALIDARLKQAKIPPSPSASDEEFLRRLSLDLTGRIPTYDEVSTFLADRSSDKRQKAIDTLLARSSYGEHFGTVWRERLAPPVIGSRKKGRDTFTPWLAAQFNENRGWDAIVTDLLTVNGRIREKPQSAFIIANSDDFDPQPNLLADATARLFWGVQLRCAECHDHPFASWTQEDFWGTAAFFSRARRGYDLGKNPLGWTITEDPPDDPNSRKFGKLMAAKGVVGPAIVVFSDGAKKLGNTVRGRFLGGELAKWNDNGPFRPRFAKWATGKDHPYFAQNTVNRWWAHFFGRGLVNPLDGFEPDATASHPEVLKLLAQQLVQSDFDLKHLVRIICTTQAYQRTSRPASGNDRDVSLYSHVAVKPMRPGMLYDALSIVLYPPQKKPGAKKASWAPRVQPLPGISKDDHVRFFRSRDEERDSSQVNFGAPQLLRLMNGSLLNRPSDLIGQLTRRGLTSSQMIDALYLSALSRPPVDSERKRIEKYVEGYENRQQAWQAVLWALLNSSEFSTNH